MVSASASGKKTRPKGPDANRMRSNDWDRELLQFHLREFLVDHLIDCLRLFEGDLEEMLVLEVIRQKSLLAPLDAMSETRRRDEGGDVTVTASHIANKTGIPRQTVRRKLFSLERRGWIANADDSTWRLAVKQGKLAIGADLAHFDRRGASRLAKLIEASLST